MATGGRVLHHLATALPDPRHTVLFVGYQAAGTRGRSLVDGARQVKMLGRHDRRGGPDRADRLDVGARRSGRDPALARRLLQAARAACSSSMASRTRRTPCRRRSPQPSGWDGALSRVTWNGRKLMTNAQAGHRTHVPARARRRGGRRAALRRRLRAAAAARQDPLLASRTRRRWPAATSTTTSATPMISRCGACSRRSSRIPDGIDAGRARRDHRATRSCSGSTPAPSTTSPRASSCRRARRRRSRRPCATAVATARHCRSSAGESRRRPARRGCTGRSSIASFEPIVTCKTPGKGATSSRRAPTTSTSASRWRTLDGFDGALSAELAPGEDGRRARRRGVSRRRPLLGPRSRASSAHLEAAIAVRHRRRRPRRCGALVRFYRTGETDDRRALRHRVGRRQRVDRGHDQRLHRGLHGRARREGRVGSARLLRAPGEDRGASRRSPSTRSGSRIGCPGIRSGASRR